MNRRSAFTLVELLVAIAIIGVLIALIAPAVQMAREAARQVQCRNNLKQISLACFNYESSNRALPGYAGEQWPFRLSFPRPYDPSMRGWNWISKAMQYMEEDTMGETWGQLAMDQAITLTDKVTEAIEYPVSTLYCPTRRPPEAIPLLGSFKTRYGDLASRTDYALNGGPADTTRPAISANIRKDGVWRVGAMTRFSNIPDGLSNTYLAGEKAMDIDKYRDGTDFGDRAPALGWTTQRAATSSYVRFAVRLPAQDSRNTCLSCHDFGSAHFNGWNAVLADGSVRTISYQLDIVVHQAMASIRGHETETIHGN